MLVDFLVAASAITAPCYGHEPVNLLDGHQPDILDPLTAWIAMSMSIHRLPSSWMASNVDAHL